MAMALRLHTLSRTNPASGCARGREPFAHRLQAHLRRRTVLYVGFYVSPVTGTGWLPGGTRKNRAGSNQWRGCDTPQIQIAEGIGVSPQDLVVSYGSVLSSSSSLSFHVSQTPSPAGPGTAYRLEGTVNFFAAEDVSLPSPRNSPNLTRS